MLPAAKMVPKELLPILDRPTIQYVVEEAASAGIQDVLLITSTGKQAIEHHFRTAEKLEERLRAGGKESLLASVNSLIAKVRVHSVDQPEQRGLGDALAFISRSTAGHFSTLALCSFSVSANTCPPVPSATK